MECSVGAGQYLVIPVTTGSKYSQYAAEPGGMYFDAETYAPGDNKGVRLLDESGTRLSAIAVAAFSEVFTRLDEDMDSVDHNMNV